MNLQQKAKTRRLIPPNPLSFKQLPHHNSSTPYVPEVHFIEPKMRAGVALLSAFSAGIVQSAAQEAFVYTFGDPQTPPNNIANLPVIAPETARLVLAQRLGVSQYHNLGTTGDITLDLVAQLGGAHHVLFKDDKEDDEIRRVLVIVEGIESPESEFELFYLY